MVPTAPATVSDCQCQCVHQRALKTRGGYIVYVLYNPPPECSPLALTGTSFVLPALNQGYQGISGSTRNQDQGWGYQGPSLIIIRESVTAARAEDHAAPLGTQGTSGISGISGIRIRDGGIRVAI
jgi:hypothetical protein